MKRAIISIILIVVTSVITFAQDANYKRREASLLSIYSRTSDFNAKLRSVKDLTKMKSEEGLKNFIKDLCYPASNSTFNTDARGVNFRIALAKAIANYKDLDQAKLLVHFESMLKVLESDKSIDVVIATLATLTEWTKAKGGDFNKRFGTSIRRRISRTDLKDSLMITKIIDSLEILKSDADAQDILRNMLTTGLTEKQKERINKILSSTE